MRLYVTWDFDLDFRTRYRALMRGRNFVICGLIGWCIEVAFTSADSLRKKDKKLMGQSSAWMFPIYGMASLIGDIAPKIAHWPVLGRGLLYGGGILAGEYVSGTILTKLGVCPWSYEGEKYAVKGIIRLDFLPFWMIAGLLYEKVLVSLAGKKGTCSRADTF